MAITILDNKGEKEMSDVEARVFNDEIKIYAEAKIIVLAGSNLPKVGSKVSLKNITPEGFDTTKEIIMEVKKIVDIEKLATGDLIEGVMVTIKGNLVSVK